MSSSSTAQGSANPNANPTANPTANAEEKMNLTFYLNEDPTTTQANAPEELFTTGGGESMEAPNVSQQSAAPGPSSASTTAALLSPKTLRDSESYVQRLQDAVLPKYTLHLPLHPITKDTPYEPRGPSGPSLAHWEELLLQRLPKLDRPEYEEAKTRTFEAFLYYKEVDRKLTKTDMAQIVPGNVSNGAAIHDEFRVRGLFSCDELSNALKAARDEHYRHLPTDSAALADYIKNNQ